MSASLIPQLVAYTSLVRFRLVRFIPQLVRVYLSSSQPSNLSSLIPQLKPPERGSHDCMCYICSQTIIYVCSMRTHIAIYASGGDGMIGSGGDRIEQEQPRRPHHLRCHTPTIEGKGK